MTRTYTINIEPHSARPPHLYKTFRKNGVTCRRESTWKKQLVKVRVWELLGPRSTGRWPELLLRFIPRLSWYWLPPRRLEIVTCNVLGRGRGGWRVREKKEAGNKGRIWWEGVNGKLLLREGREQESFLKLYTYTQYSEQRRPCGRSHGASELLVVGENSTEEVELAKVIKPNKYKCREVYINYESRGHGPRRRKWGDGITKKKRWRVGADAEDVKRETAIKGDALFGSLYGFP